MDRVQVAYATLGIAPGATDAEVKRAYRTLVRRWHPDHYGRDPKLQQQAVEMLKVVNEAYELVTQDRVRRQDAPDGKPEAQSPPVVRRYQPGGETVTPKAARSDTDQEPAPAGFPASGTVSCWTSWPNILFVAFVVSVFCLSATRAGSFFPGAGYAMQLIALPALFAVACNRSRLGGNRWLWAAYVAIICLSAVVVLIDAVSARNDYQEALQFDGSPSAGVSGGSGSYGLGGSGAGAGGASSGSYSRHSDGPVPPHSPYVEAPAAPRAPEAPLAPVAPLAAPAR